MDDDDDDVIFVGSPLYDHLRDVGLEDFEYAEKSRNENVTLESCKKDQETWKEKLKLFLKNILLKDFNAQYREFGVKLNQVVLESSLLTSTDKLILQDFSAQYSTYKHVFFENWYRCACVVVLLVGYCASNFGSENETAKIMELVLLAFLTLVTAVFAVQLLAFIFCWKVTGELLGILKDTIRVFSDLKSLIRKGIRNIQEAELIARGFTLASITNPISRLEHSSLPFRTPEKQCPEYRRFLWSTIKGSFLQYRAATLDMLNSCPLLSEMDVPSYYVACVPLKDLGPLFEEETNVNQLGDVTNDFSVSSLKLAFQIMELQQSEFLRRIGLCFLPVSDTAFCLPAIKTLKANCKLLSMSNEEIVAKLRRYQLFQRIHLEDSPKVENKLSGQTDLHKFRTAVHSISLHLQAIVLRIQKLEESSESQCEILDNLLLEVRGELDASHVCLEEASSHLLSMKGQNLKAMNLPLPPVVPPTIQDNGASAPPIPLFEMGDPVVPDQVFEASTSGLNDFDDVLNDFEDNYWIDEKVRRKAAREASTHLFKELKSVLVVKAEEHRVREEKALQGRTVDNTQTPDKPSIDTSDPDHERESSARKSLETPTDAAVTEDSSKTFEKVVKQGIIGESNENDNKSFVKNCLGMPTDAAIAEDSGRTFEKDVLRRNVQENKDNEPEGFQFGGCFSLAASVAAQAAQRSKMLGLKVDTIGDDTFGDSSDDDE